MTSGGSSQKRPSKDCFRVKMLFPTFTRREPLPASPEPSSFAGFWLWARFYTLQQTSADNRYVALKVNQIPQSAPAAHSTQTLTNAHSSQTEHPFSVPGSAADAWPRSERDRRSFSSLSVVMETNRQHSANWWTVGTFWGTAQHSLVRALAKAQQS